MPFTFSHPAIILPLTYLPRRWFSLTGLIIGSLTPDFEYFIRMTPYSLYSHTLSGLFWFDIPLGLLLCFIFHNLVRDSLCSNLPTELASRLTIFKQFDWNQYLKTHGFVVIVSILIGAFSHLFWDSFTHGYGYFVEKIPFLSHTFSVFGKQIAIFKILQHSSTLTGGLVIMFAFWTLPVDKNVVQQVNVKYWFILISLTFILLAIKFLSGLNIREYGKVIVSFITAGLVSLILTPVLLKKIK